jgi:hypothetical protein
MTGPGAATDGELLDLVQAALRDPNLHTDVRLRIARQITELVRATQCELYGDSAPEEHERALAAHGGHVPSLLEAVLVDPNLHTDMRMRIYRDIPQMLRDERQRDCG